MKRIPILLAALCLSALLMGAAAPVMQTKGLYVNDYASVIFDAHRSTILTISQDLFEQTGIQLVVLTVDNLGGMTLEEYGAAIVEGWGIGGPEGQNGVLILVSVDDNASWIYTGSGLEGLAGLRDTKIEIAGSNVSLSIIDAYRPIALEAYRLSGVAPDSSIQEILDQPPAGSSSGPFSAGTIIILAIVLLAVGRSYRVSRKYRAKYLKGHVRKIKSYTRTYNEEDEFNNEKIYRIDYDGQD